MYTVKETELEEGGSKDGHLKDKKEDPCRVQDDEGITLIITKDGPYT